MTTDTRQRWWRSSKRCMDDAVAVSADTIAQCDCGCYVDPTDLRGEWQDAFNPERCPNCAEKKLEHVHWLMNYYGVSE
jgi:hypothetical protein